jgi:hypothetical protein
MGGIGGRREEEEVGGGRGIEVRFPSTFIGNKQEV